LKHLYRKGSQRSCSTQNNDAKLTFQQRKQNWTVGMGQHFIIWLSQIPNIVDVKLTFGQKLGSFAKKHIDVELILSQHLNPIELVSCPKPKRVQSMRNQTFKRNSGGFSFSFSIW